MSRNGELHIILGPMFSGKTTRLIELSQSIGHPLFINYALDTRYHPTLLTTHSGIQVPCIQTLELKPLLCQKELIESDAIFINEAQFFPDLFAVVNILVETLHKRVFVCGLDGDYQRNPFGELLRLIPLCDTIEKLYARCYRSQNEDE